jgi:hypothetical protein
MDNNQDSQIVREDYEPPSVEDIPLRAGETLLAGCKTVGGAGPGRAQRFHLCGSCASATTS